ncbi:WD40 repeat domain-containing protein [Bradyrhizobium sp. STM 3566]|uniref:WD40 repeat domain-containing protein n=1 Tax=Bradyrhizobium sp. STM 3566 TaxID=578928 RepID=UPI00388DE751
MDTMEAEAGSATLYDLLGRHWKVGAPVTNVAFDAAGKAVAFALADGSLAIAPLVDSEPPIDRCRIALDEGRATISPRRNPVPPLTRVVISDGRLHLASVKPSGFIASDGGELLHVSTAGVTRQISRLRAAIDLVVPVCAGGVLVSSGGSLIHYQPNGEIGWVQERGGGNSSAMAVSPDGRSFAIGADGCLLIRSFGARPEPAASFDVGLVSTLSWSPDGSWLAASVENAGVVLVRLADAWIVRIPTYPANVASLSWSADSRALVTSGAYRIIAWDVSSLIDDSQKPTSLATGRARFVLADTVDIHPERQLVAAGYADGVVAIAKIGHSDEMVVRPPGGGAIHALQWSSDGQHLAVGTSEGEAAIVTFPPHVFK